MRVYTELRNKVTGGTRSLKNDYQQKLVESGCPGGGKERGDPGGNTE